MSIFSKLANPLRPMFQAQPLPETRHARMSNPGMGIYDPPEPSTSVLPPDAKQVWDAAYEQAMKSYGDAGIAESTAWRKVKLSWKPTAANQWEQCTGGMCRPWPAPQKLPAPASDLIGLGVLVEYGYIDRKGTLIVWGMDQQMPPILWWDDKRKALYAFPGTPYPPCMLLNPQRDSNAAKLYETWTKRKPECGLTELTIPLPKMTCVGASDTVSYRSDKWKAKHDDPRVVGAQEYIHKHWHEVWTWIDNVKNPKAIMIQGGELDMHAKGIIH